MVQWDRAARGSQAAGSAGVSQASAAGGPARHPPVPDTEPVALAAPPWVLVAPVPINPELPPAGAAEWEGPSQLLHYYYCPECRAFLASRGGCVAGPQPQDEQQPKIDGSPPSRAPSPPVPLMYCQVEGAPELPGAPVAVVVPGAAAVVLPPPLLAEAEMPVVPMRSEGDTAKEACLAPPASLAAAPACGMQRKGGSGRSLGGLG